MKTLLLLIASGFFALTAPAQKNDKTNQPDKNKKILIVDASCGECQFGMKGQSCDLAVRINGKSYFVDGTSIDEHGDAHAEDGFCKAIRKAKVQGEIQGDRFKATYFMLLPESKTQSRQ